jgi:hypothetical protein
LDQYSPGEQHLNTRLGTKKCRNTTLIIGFWLDCVTNPPTKLGIFQPEIPPASWHKRDLNLRNVLTKCQSNSVASRHFGVKLASVQLLLTLYYCTKRDLQRRAENIKKGFVVKMCKLIRPLERIKRNKGYKPFGQAA